MSVTFKFSSFNCMSLDHCLRINFANMATQNFHFSIHGVSNGEPTFFAFCVVFKIRSSQWQWRVKISLTIQWPKWSSTQAKVETCLSGFNNLSVMSVVCVVWARVKRCPDHFSCESKGRINKHLNVSPSFDHMGFVALTISCAQAVLIWTSKVQTANSSKFSPKQNQHLIVCNLLSCVSSKVMKTRGWKPKCKSIQRGTTAHSKDFMPHDRSCMQSHLRRKLVWWWRFSTLEGTKCMQALLFGDTQVPNLVARNSYKADNSATIFEGQKHDLENPS